MTLFFIPRLFFFALFFSSISLLVQAQGRKHYYSFQNANQYQVVGDTTLRDNIIQSFLRNYKDSIQLSMEDIVVQSDIPLSKAQPESTLGNWVTDNILKHFQKEKKKIDACIISYGSIGLDYLAPGAIKRKDIYHLIPIDNEIILIHISGQSLKYLCDSIAQMNGIPLSGISFEIKNNNASKIMINNYPLNENLVYTLAVNDYLLKNKKFNTLFYKANTERAYLRIRATLFENTEELNKKSEHLNVKLENRISYAE